MTLSHHRRIARLIELEREIFSDLADKPSLLSPVTTEILRYAIGLARIGQIKGPTGDVDLFELIAPFRHWLIEQLDYLTTPSIRNSLIRSRTLRSKIDWKGIEQLTQQLHARIGVTRGHVLRTCVDDFGEDTLEQEITQRQLVLVLGGGGGCGYPHLGVFSLFAELGIVPTMIVGSSMGALLGLFRACTVEYEPLLASMGLPRPREYRRVFSPYRGYTRYGFPGVFEMKMRPLATEIFSTMLGRSVPNLDELPIAFRPIVTGLLGGIDVQLAEVEEQISKTEQTWSPFRFTRRFGLFSATASMLLQNPRNLTEVQFGRPGELESFDAVDATGFSCSVPGFIHYDIFRRDSLSSPTLRSYMKARNIFRLTDGGVVSNVPARNAWECVNAGEIGSRNAFIASFDAFAPQLNLNAPFIPVQKLIQGGVREQTTYSNFHHEYRNPPSPVKVLLSLDDIESAVARTREQLNAYKPFFALMLRRVPTWNHLSESWTTSSPFGLNGT